MGEELAEAGFLCRPDPPRAPPPLLTPVVLDEDRVLLTVGEAVFGFGAAVEVEEA